MLPETCPALCPLRAPREEVRGRIPSVVRAQVRWRLPPAALRRPRAFLPLEQPSPRPLVVPAGAAPPPALSPYSRKTVFPLPQPSQTTLRVSFSNIPLCFISKFLGCSYFLAFSSRLTPSTSVMTRRVFSPRIFFTSPSV